MQIATLNKMIDKSKAKKDGIYSYQGSPYRVRNNQLTHFAESGKIYKRSGKFTTIIGEYNFYYASEAAKLLKLIKE